MDTTASLPSQVPQHIVLVTGMSGAGKSEALKSLEDLGFEAVDNIPLSILKLLLRPSKHQRPYLAIGVDVRNRDFSVQLLLAKLRNLRQRKNLHVTLLFLDCSDEVLQRRFTVTRRKHPISSDRLVTDGIKHERQLISSIKPYADYVLDSTDFTLPEFRQWIKRNFATDKKQNFSIVVTSFSFRNGLPREADLVFDVRFLKNPHYDPHLMSATGKDKAVQAFIEEDPSWTMFFQNLQQLILPLLPRYMDEGKSYLTIAIGCTGGKHRSVYVAEKLFEVLTAKHYKVDVRHRDVHKQG